jgi:hypothetical protein
MRASDEVTQAAFDAFAEGAMLVWFSIAKAIGTRQPREPPHVTDCEKGAHVIDPGTLGLDATFPDDVIARCRNCAMCVRYQDATVIWEDEGT